MDKMIQKSSNTQKVIEFPIHFFCCSNPNHIPYSTLYLEDDGNRRQYCRICKWFFYADMFITDKHALEWINSEIKKKKMDSL